MKGIQGHFGDNYPHLDNKKKTPNNFAEYLDSCTDVPATEAELEAGIVVVDDAKAVVVSKHNILKLAAIKIRDDGWDSLSDIQKSKVMVYVLRGLIED